MQVNLKITSTSIGVLVNGIVCRQWDAVTPQGVPCKVFVAALGVDPDHPTLEFDMELEPLEEERWVPRGYGIERN